jgi:hypothetical protein
LLDVADVGADGVDAGASTKSNKLVATTPVGT